MSVQAATSNSFLVFNTVSIHPMCRFKMYVCVVVLRRIRFNTSYVSVQGNADNLVRAGALEFQYILCVGSSISGNTENKVVPAFQYILCVGSRLAETAMLHKL